MNQNNHNCTKLSVSVNNIIMAQTIINICASAWSTRVHHLLLPLLLNNLSTPYFWYYQLYPTTGVYECCAQCPVCPTWPCTVTNINSGYVQFYADIFDFTKLNSYFNYNFNLSWLSIDFVLVTHPPSTDHPPTNHPSPARAVKRSFKLSSNCNSNFIYNL